MIATKTLLLMVMGRKTNCRVLQRVLARSPGQSPGSVYRHNENSGKKQQ